MKKLTNKEARKFRKAGYNACKQGTSTEECPYEKDSQESYFWFRGFDDFLDEEIGWRDE